MASRVRERCDTMIDLFREYIDTGREIEFTYDKKEYSITYYNDNRANYISFCEFYKEPIDVSSFDELLEKKYNGISIKNMIESLSEDDYSVF